MSDIPRYFDLSQTKPGPNRRRCMIIKVVTGTAPKTEALEQMPSLTLPSGIEQQHFSACVIASDRERITKELISTKGT